MFDSRRRTGDGHNLLAEMPYTTNQTTCGSKTHFLSYAPSLPLQQLQLLRRSCPVNLCQRTFLTQWVAYSMSAHSINYTWRTRIEIEIIVGSPAYSDVEFILPRRGRGNKGPRRIYAARRLLKRVEYFYASK